MVSFSSFEDLKKLWPKAMYILYGPEDHPLKIHIGRTEGKVLCSFCVLNLVFDRDYEGTEVIKVDPVNPATCEGVRFTLLEHKFEEEFLRLCWDLVEYTKDSSAPEKDFKRRYKSWKKLFKRASKDIINREVQRGLAGELLFLQEAASHLGYAAAVDAWIGPDDGYQDFVFENTWAEIKTIAHNARFVNISSLEQLSPKNEGYLAVIRTKDVSEGGISLISLADDICNELRSSPSALDLFETKLTKVGFNREHAEEYEKNRFEILRRDYYSVADDFPRICVGDISPAIDSVNYRILLNAIDGFRIGEIAWKI